MDEYVVDTCSAIEYLSGSKKHLAVISSAVKLYVTEFMLAELYFVTQRDAGEEAAEKYFEVFAAFLERTPENSIKEAMKLRHRLKLKGLRTSYADALGYQKALEKNAKFLTGDGAFKNLPNVEFIQ